MIDCAPLLVADALGLFEKYGARVELKRQTGWASIREQILHEELDAAHAHASLVYTIHCGIGVVARRCLTGVVLSHGGSAITLSNRLYDDYGVRDGATLAEAIRGGRLRRKLILACVADISSQSFVLRQWLRQAGLDPDREVRIVVLPSPLVHENLSEKYIDGYCVGEPWSSILLVDREAWCVALSDDVCPSHPEKVLLARANFAEKHESQHLGMIAAIIEAGLLCEDPAWRGRLVEILAQPRYLDLSERYLANCLLGDFETGRGRRASSGLVRYSGPAINIPSRDKARWVFEQIERNCQLRHIPSFRRDVMRKVFREDIYWSAIDLVRSVSPGLLPASRQRLRASASEPRPGLLSSPQRQNQATTPHNLQAHETN